MLSETLVMLSVTIKREQQHQPASHLAKCNTCSVATHSEQLELSSVYPASTFSQAEKQSSNLFSLKATEVNVVTSRRE